jgi:hypothetical protein
MDYVNLGAIGLRLGSPHSSGVQGGAGQRVRELRPRNRDAVSRFLQAGDRIHDRRAPRRRSRLQRHQAGTGRGSERVAHDGRHRTARCGPRRIAAVTRGGRRRAGDEPSLTNACRWVVRSDQPTRGIEQDARKTDRDRRIDVKTDVGEPCRRASGDLGHRRRLQSRPDASQMGRRSDTVPAFGEIRR